MRYWIIEQDRGLSVRIDDVGGQEQALLERIHRCRRSAWACPSGECRNVESIDERAEGGSIVLTLTPRPDTRLDRAGIRECLHYMLGQAVEE
ncbi:MAG TPA: hypothetical protein VF059_11575 [Casimicrobiaceae bacterium]